MKIFVDDATGNLVKFALRLIERSSPSYTVVGRDCEPLDHVYRRDLDALKDAVTKMEEKA